MEGKTVYACAVVQYVLNGPTCKSTLEFLQEKVLGDCINSKKSTSYCNLFRVINCIEKKQEQSEQDDDGDDIGTQEHFDFD